MQCDRHPAFGGRPAADITGPTDFPPGRHPSLTCMSGSAILAIVAHERFLTARIDVAGGPDIRADRTRVPWWSFTKTALAAQLSNSSHAANAASTRGLMAAHIRCASCFNTAPAF